MNQVESIKKHMNWMSENSVWYIQLSRLGTVCLRENAPKTPSPAVAKVIHVSDVNLTTLRGATHGMVSAKDTTEVFLVVFVYHPIQG